MEGGVVIPASQYNKPFYILQFLQVNFRLFDPSWTAVAKSWSRVPQEQRDQHFFATLDFEYGSTIFQRVRFCLLPCFINIL